MNVETNIRQVASTAKIDPITLEIVRSGLVLAADQVNARIIRSATSIVVRESEDCSAALFDERGRLLAESANIPIHLGAIGTCLRTVIDHYLPLDQWHEGDVVVTNDPYAGPGSLSSHHTNDFIVFTPLFWSGKMVAISALTVHHVDVGGMQMGTRGWSVEIEQEGLRIPPVKVVKGGVIDEQLMSIISTNSRLGEELDSDLRAQIATICLAKDDIDRLFDRYGEDTMRLCFQELIDYSERRTREEISKLKDGVYRHEELILDDGSMGGPFKIAVTMTIAGDEVEFDFSGTDPQIHGPINAPLSATSAATYYVMRCVTDPNIPNTEGSKAPIKIVAPAGTLVNAKKPAACNQRMVVSHSVVDLIFGAIQAAAPDRSMGDSVGCAYNELMATNIMTGGQMFFGEAVPGGIGATSEQDGASCLSCHITNTRMAPVEMTEIGLPVSYLRRELADDSGGPGRNRGGLGIVQSYEIRIDEPKLSHTSQKTKTPPQGVAGGHAGRSGRWFVNKNTAQERELLNAMGDLDYLQRGDVVTLTTAGGGGYGNPLERDVESVIEDVREGYVSIESALADYGVEIDPQSFDVISLKR